MNIMTQNRKEHKLSNSNIQNMTTSYKVDYNPQDQIRGDETNNEAMWCNSLN